MSPQAVCGLKGNVGRVANPVVFQAGHRAEVSALVGGFGPTRASAAVYACTVAVPVAQALGPPLPPTARRKFSPVAVLQKPLEP